MPIPLRRYASATLCALSFCAFAAAAKASPLPTSLTFTGDTQGESPLWNRPTINTSPGTSLALAGGGQGWVAEEFTVATSGQYTYNVTATDTGTGTGTGQWTNGQLYNILGFL